MESETPLSFMFADLKQFAGISNRDAAQMLLTDRPVLGGVSPRDRVSERTFLSREIVHATPGYLPASFFAPFDASMPALAAHMQRKGGRHLSSADIEHHIAQELREPFCAVLASWNINDRLYANAVEHIGAMRLSSDKSRCTLYLMLYCATACLGDPARAIGLTERFAQDRALGSFSTQPADVGENTAAASPAPSRLGLVRLLDGKITGQIHPLSEDAEGTVIGSLTTGAHAIVDVGPDVSRSHLRIRYDGARWVAEPLGSTNGTTVISGEDRHLDVIEPPAQGRTASWQAQPFEVLPGDILNLGASTSFLVLEIAK